MHLNPDLTLLFPLSCTSQEVTAKRGRKEFPLLDIVFDGERTVSVYDDTLGEEAVYVRPPSTYFLPPFALEDLLTWERGLG